MGHQKIYRVTVRLDTEHDTDLITWLEGQVPGSRSGLIRTVWRAGLKQINGPGWEPIDIEDMRRMVAEELNRVLAGQRPMTVNTAPPTEESQVDMEAKYGAKLDKLLGGFAGGSQRPEDEG
jgi:hypothetical protein